MKKLLSIVVLGLLWSNFAFAIEYCYEYNKTRKPLEPATFVSLTFLEFELECLGKIKERKIFIKERNELMEKMIKSQIDASLAKGPDVEKKLDDLEQDYINSVVKLFYKLKE